MTAYIIVDNRYLKIDSSTYLLITSIYEISFVNKKLKVYNNIISYTKQIVNITVIIRNRK